MSRSHSALNKLFIAIILGCIGGILFHVVWPYLPIGNWSHYEQLPSKALRFMGHDGNELFDAGVYIEAADGIIYHCQDSNLPCISSQEVNASVPSRNCGSPIGITPWSPGKVTDKLSYRFCGVDGFADRYYIILEDGSVWKWSSRGSAAMAGYFLLFFWMLLGAIAGALVWLLSNVFTKRTTRQ